jgi:DNA-binding CsgD family transcriptional regulator
VVLQGYLNPGTQPSPELTPREREIVQLIAEGKATKEVADALGISVKTADTHRSNLMRKLDLHSAADVVRYAIRNQIVQP